MDEKLRSLLAAKNDKFEIHGERKRAVGEGCETEEDQRVFQRQLVMKIQVVVPRLQFFILYNYILNSYLHV
jgi:hypothetical protein